MTSTSQTNPPKPTVVTADAALRIVRLDGEKAYRGDLSRYRITVALEQDGWHVDYELKDLYSCGGGPHYIIDPVDGRIVWKIYEQ